MPSEWWETFFEEWLPVMQAVPRRRSDQQARFIVDTLKLRPGDAVLDCPCGSGRLAVPMAKMGLRVTGVDFWQPSLDAALADARRRRVQLQLIRKDMRQLDFSSRFDAAINVWTSFGYFENEADDLRVLRRLFAALKPGGRVFLTLVNRDWIMKNFIERDWFTMGGVTVAEDKVFDYTTSRIHSTWHYIKDGRVVPKPMSLRVYSWHEMIGMLAKAGFDQIDGIGTESGEPISRDNRWLIVWATKPSTKRRR
jgi:2-polyprenyl-3-methyl-5-hydroxy-6-metoxy-1,4-benzoquinol methylase